MFTEQLQRERRMLEEIWKYHRNHLTDEGILMCQKHNGFVRWMRRYKSGGTVCYQAVRKKDREQAERLALNHYRIVMMETIQEKIAEIDRFMQGCQGTGKTEKLPSAGASELLRTLHNPPRRPVDFLRQGSPYSELLLPYLRQEYSWVIDWFQSEYKKNTDKQEKLVFDTEAGIKVRSKSEVLATNRLRRSGVLFHYEEQLVLPGDVVFPDWLIPLSKAEQIAWEHNGAMDIQGYNYRTRGKVVSYLEGQWLPGVNMIDTYESREHPFSEEDVEYVMEWLLPRYRAAYPDLPPDGAFTLYDVMRGTSDAEE